MQRPNLSQSTGFAQRFSKEDKALYITIAITALAAILLITFLMIWSVSRATGCASKNPNDDTNSQQSGSQQSSYTAVLDKTDDMGQSYIDSMIFLGDSNTAHMRSFGVLSGGKSTKQVWTPVSSTLALDSQITSKKIVYPETDEQITIAEAARRAKPKYLVISLGTNGLSYLDKEQFKYCYTKLLNAIKEASPDTKIIIQSIYPVTDWYKNLKNEKINEANGWLIEIATEAKVKYIDTASVLKNSNGALKETFNSYHNDGYHINAEAYEKILDYIRTHGWQ